MVAGGRSSQPDAPALEQPAAYAVVTIEACVIDVTSSARIRAPGWRTVDSSVTRPGHKIRQNPAYESVYIVQAHRRVG